MDKSVTRRFIVMRHAKAEGHGRKPDFDRELTISGIEDARSVAAQFTEFGIVPDHVLCSASRRTRDTLAAVLACIPGDCTIALRQSLYEAEPPQLRDSLRTAPGQCVLLVGHNPSVHTLAVSLAGGEAAQHGFASSFPTSTAAVFTVGFAIDTARFERLIVP